MIKFKLIIPFVLLLLIHPGCLARYGEARLNQLLLSVNELKKTCNVRGEELSEKKIKEKLGKPGFLKPIYESNLDFFSLDKLKENSGVLLVPNRTDLYKDMLVAINENGCNNIKLLSYVYDKTGSLEEFSLTFYIGSFKETGKGKPVVFGWDYVKYENNDKCLRKRKVFSNLKIDNPVDYLRLSYSFLIDSAIGFKQFAGEVIKSPFSFLEAELYKNMIIERKIPFYKLDGFKAAIEDWRNGATSLTYRFRVDGNQGFLSTTQNLLGEIPLVGSVFDQWYINESESANKLFLSRGIFGGNDSAQNMSAWIDYLIKHSGDYPQGQPCRQATISSSVKKEQKDTKYDNMPFVKAIPYKYGSIVDVLWALFNISHGYAYDMASEIVFNYDVNPGDTVLLSGHSGGIQRIFSTARILYDDGIKAKKMYGIAGPALGYVPCSKAIVVLNCKPLQDPVSEVSKILKYITLNLLTLNIKWHWDDRKIQQREDILYEHVTPGFVDGRTRVKYDGYLRENCNFFFNSN